MTFGSRVTEALFKAKGELGAKLTPDKMTEIIDHLYRQHQSANRREHYPVTKDGPANPLFDALAAAENSNPAELTATASRRIAVSLARIKQATPAVTAEEITRRAVRYRELFPRTIVTANALEANWPKLNCFKFRTPPPKPLPDASERQPNFGFFNQDGGINL